MFRYIYFQSIKSCVSRETVKLTIINVASLFLIELKATYIYIYMYVMFPQVLDVERMLAKSATPADVLALETPQQQMENHPVIRTLYDHNGVSS